MKQSKEKTKNHESKPQNNPKSLRIISPLLPFEHKVDSGDLRPHGTFQVRHQFLQIVRQRLQLLDLVHAVAALHGVQLRRADLFFQRRSVFAYGTVVDEFAVGASRVREQSVSNQRS